MTEQEAIDKLNSLSKEWDNEKIHVDADRVLRDFLRENGYPEVAAAYDNLQEKVEFWYA